MDVKTENLSILLWNCPLIFSFDDEGGWDAVSMVIDPDIENPDGFTKEDCLMWRIVVCEDGTFAAGESDKLLIENRRDLARNSWVTLARLQEAIEEAELSLRLDADNMGLKLLGAVKYKA